MIKRILTYYAERLDEYLSRNRHQPEGLATVGLIGAAGEESPNKVVVNQLISEGENADGIPAWMHVGYKHPDGIQQRGQYLSMIHGKYYPMTD